jgi:oxygen-independent coproporphyrinogen-3 oxidase
MTCTLRDNILKFDRTVPRYTSYPTAPNFVKKDNIDYPVLQSGDVTSLYIHVPFCQSMCWYCGCHTKVTKRYDPIAEYVDFLLKEIDLVTSHQPNTINVSHIHFGGGSPGMLSPQDFERIMDAIRLNFNVADDAEIAIEIDPRGVTENRVIAYAKMGVNRISLGTQDFNDDVMKSVNREQPFDLSDKAIKLFREHGINHFNLDLIYGLPHQTMDKMKHTIDLALSLDPDRISLFGYAHVPWMKKHMRLIDETTLPDKMLRLDLFETGAKMLENSGYTSIGIDHFVKPNDTMAIALKNKKLKRNFQGYTTDQSNIMIGLGVSSIGKTENAYFQNHADMPLYKFAIEEGRLPLSKSCNITSDDKIRGEIIERIMCDFEIDLSDYAGDYSNELHHIKKYKDQGFLNIDNNKISINVNARPIARLVCAAFDVYLPPDTVQKHSQVI